MNLTLHRWIALSRAGLAARLSLFGFAALGHYAFLATLSWDQAPGLWLPFLLAAPNLMVLAAVTFGRPRVDGLPFGPTLTVVGATALTASAYGVLASQRHGADDLLVQAMVAGMSGAMCGLLGATVATPLCLAVQRWRLHPAPRRALDVWATLASMAAVFAVVRPRLLGRTNWETELRLPPSHPTLGRLLLPLDLSLAALALAIAAAVFALDLLLRRAIARARDGAIEGRRVSLTGEAAAGDAVSLATMHDEEMVAVMGPAGEAGYRTAATEPVLAAFPRAPRVSWRLLAMPAVALVCALGLALVR